MRVKIIREKIYEIRGHKVMLDFDLANLYETETKLLKRAVRRNKSRFPDDFMFELTKEEYTPLRYQFGTLKRGAHRKYLPFAFTEHGVTMLASILNNEQAVKMSVAIVRAFIALRQMALQYKDLAEKLSKLEKQYNKKFKGIYQALNFLMEQHDFSKRERIGFRKDKNQSH
jgi:hypothetical protein